MYRRASYSEFEKTVRGMHVNWLHSLSPFPALPHAKEQLRPEGMWLKSDEKAKMEHTKEREQKEWGVWDQKGALLVA